MIELPRCRICNNPTERLTDDQFKLDYYHCKACEFIFIDEKNILSASDEKERYLEHENSMENEGYVNMFNAFIEKSITPYRETIKTALDFGCGTGPVLAELLRRNGFVVDIYDVYFSPERVYEDKQYDLITCTEVLEHVKDPVSIFKLFKSHLTTTGLLSVMTLFHPRDENVFKTWWYRRDNTHISFYTPHTFEVLAEMVGMSIVFVDSKNICVLKNK